MQAGRMRERVMIQNPTVATDAAGQATYSYTGLGTTVWASVRNTSQSQGTQGEVQPSGFERFDVRMRYNSSVDYDTRLTWSGRTLQVVGIENYRNLDHELHLECEEADQ